MNINSMLSVSAPSNMSEIYSGVILFDQTYGQDIFCHSAKECKVILVLCRYMCCHALVTSYFLLCGYVNDPLQCLL